MKGTIVRTITTLAVAVCAASFAQAQEDRDSTGTVAEPTATGATSSAGVSAYAMVTVQVDDTYCATGGVQCTGTGHTAEAAGPGNHNPVRLVVQVAAPSPINSLPESTFAFFTRFVPAGGSTLSRLSCSSCFQNAGGGTYTLFVHPSVGNWRSGSYHAQVGLLVDGQLVLPATIEIEIPF